MRSAFLLMVFVLLWNVPGQASAAQQAEVRTVAVRDGKVFIDGRAVEVSTLPPTLRVDGVDVQFSVIGEARPVLEIGGRRYRVETRRLVDLGAVESPVEVFFRTPIPEASARLSYSGTSGSSGAVAPRQGDAPRRATRVQQGVIATPSGTYDLTGRLLSAEVAAVVGSRQPAGIATAEADQVRVASAFGRAATVEETAAMNHVLAELPRIELQHYLADVQRENRALFDRLQREQALELRTLDLAARIRNLSEGARRAHMQEQLRLLLEEAFTLKQDNRRHEIQQLESQLEALRERLRAREAHHDVIIDRRLRALLGEDDDSGW